MAAPEDVNVVISVASPETPAQHEQPPIEALYAATQLNNMGIRTRIHDSRIAAKLPEVEPDIIFLLTQTYDRTQCYSLTLGNAGQLADRLRNQYSNSTLIACGVHADIEPAATSSALRIEHQLPGEIEASIPWLLDQMSSSPLDEINLDDAPRQVDVNSLPIPDYDLVDLGGYRSVVFRPEDGQLTYAQAGLIFANRGCPYPCSYCFVWFGKKPRIRDPRSVVEEMKALEDRGITQAFFLDYTFTLRKEWVTALCEEILRAKISLRWSCQTRCERVDEDLLALMRRAGCVGIFYGIEAPWIAETDMRKPTSRPRIERAIRLTRAAEIGVVLFILIGLELKDSSRAKRLIRWLDGLPAFFSARPLTPRPHTELFIRHSTDHATDWEEYRERSRDIGRLYWPDELSEVEADLHALPNNVLNQPVHSAGQER